MQTPQRRQGIVLTFAACLWLVLIVATFVTGEYREMSTWRVWLQVALGAFSIALLWQTWKPGGAGRT